MPCLNEAETVATCVRKAVKFIADNGISGEVVVADNGSTDGSQKLAEDAGARVVGISDKGYGNARMGGILAARGEYVIMGDADDSYDFTNLMPFIEELRKGSDLVMGNGFRRDSAIALGLQATGMEFASEMVVKATLAKQKITEVPTTLKKDGRSRPPHLRSWRDGWRHL